MGKSILKKHLIGQVLSFFIFIVLFVLARYFIAGQSSSYDWNSFTIFISVFVIFVLLVTGWLWKEISLGFAESVLSAGVVIYGLVYQDVSHFVSIIIILIMIINFLWVLIFYSGFSNDRGGNWGDTLIASLFSHVILTMISILAIESYLMSAI